MFFYGLAVAWFQFAWLYRTRSAYHYASLPIRRETQFVSRYLAGLLFHLGPALVVTLLTMAAGAAKGENVVLPALIFLACSTLMFLFYYGLAVFCAHLTGHVAAMPVLYLIANFLAPVLEEVLLLVANALIFGLSASQHLWPPLLSPLYYCLNRNIFSVEWLNRGGVTIGYVFTGWEAGAALRRRGTRPLPSWPSCCSGGGAWRARATSSRFPGSSRCSATASPSAAASPWA